ncbi:MAG TPA: hypothetical protein DCE65_00580 [Clostridiales bacterium]|nr:hypothetical protein [Clostridiales bacterium]
MNKTKTHSAKTIAKCVFCSLRGILHSGKKRVLLTISRKSDIIDMRQGQRKKHGAAAAQKIFSEFL